MINLYYSQLHTTPPILPDKDRISVDFISDHVSGLAKLTRTEERNIQENTSML